MSRTRRNHDELSAFGLYRIELADDKHGRDKKPGCKARGWYKRMRNRIRRAKAKQAMRRRMEPPRFRRENDYKISA